MALVADFGDNISKIKRITLVNAKSIMNFEVSRATSWAFLGSLVLAS